MKKIILGLLVVSSLAGCKKAPVPLDKLGDFHGLTIEEVPSSASFRIKANFERYISYETPNGGSIPIYAQDEISNEQLYRAYHVMDWIITNINPNLDNTSSDEIANRMSQNDAQLVLRNGSHQEGQTEFNGQPLHNTEIQVEGGLSYINQNYENRDATYEEILHLVHDKGIGIDGSNMALGEAPKVQKIIRDAQIIALNNQYWGINSNSWINELRAENSLSQEYFASVFDSYWGLWGAFSEPGGMWGIYIAKSRSDIKVKESEGWNLMEKVWLNKHITYPALISADFSGDFSLSFDSNLPYTHHSQYLKEVIIGGTKDNNVIINELDNIVRGNDGQNTVVFSGNIAEYTISEGASVQVTDKTSNRDGDNVLYDIEILQFLDHKHTL